MGFISPIQLLATAAGAAASSFLSPSPKAPTINIPPPPKVQLPPGYGSASSREIEPAKTPNAPISTSDTAAVQRARIASRGKGGPSSLVLSSTGARKQSNGSSNSTGGLVTRTTLLGR